MIQIRRFPVATASIVILNAVIFVLGVLSGSQTQIIQGYGFIPNHLFYWNNEQDDRDNNLADSAQQNPLSSLPLQLPEQQQQSSSLSDSMARLFTSMFIHANIAHIAFNLIALVYIGRYA